MKSITCSFFRSLLLGIACQQRRAVICLFVTVLSTTLAHAESGIERTTAATSPRGTFRIEEERGRDEGRAADVWITTAWIVPASEPTKRVRLGDTYDDSTGRSFHISPDEQWVFATVHIHSQLGGAILYRRKADLQFHLVMADDMEGIYDGPEWKFPANDKPASDRKQGGESDESLSSYGGYQGFIAWSADSARLLVVDVDRERSQKRQERIHHLHYFYCNLRRGTLEHTDYLRTLDCTLRGDDAIKNYVWPASAEPLDPLPPEAQIRGRYEAADRQLNKIYNAVLEREGPEERQKSKQYQRIWLKARDDGAEKFAATGSKAERPSRRLQYLADATQARVRDLEHQLKLQ
jgi:hypothetical protein